MAYTLSPKENFLAALHHEKTEYVPSEFHDVAMCGFLVPIEHGNGGETDWFGVRWSASDSTAGGAIPEPGNFILKDITEWKKVIQFPDIDAFDWQKAADEEMPKINREIFPVEAFAACSIYERLAAFMGFENALISMAEEPEATFELLSALADFRCNMIKHFAQYYKPDSYIYFDDVAAEKNLFMSPKAYHELIFPLHKRMCDTALECGILPIQHTCGHAELVVEDMIGEGNAAWHSIQPTNDLETLIPKYAGKFCFMGGYNSNGEPGYEFASEEVIREEVRRCYNVYGQFGTGYIFSGGGLNQSDNPDPMRVAMIIGDEFMKLRKEHEN